MSGTVSWVLELSIAEGKAKALKTLYAEMVEATQVNEPGALVYEYFMNADETVCHVYERYADSAATMVHLKNFGEHFADRFLDGAKPTRLTVYGDPDDAVRKGLAAFNPAYLTEVIGFAR